MQHTRAAAAPGLPSLRPDDHGDSRSLAALVSAAARPATAHPDSVLLDLGRQWIDLRQALQQVNDDTSLTVEQSDEVLDRIHASKNRLVAAATALSARTPAGLAVKARMLATIAAESAGCTQLVAATDDEVIAVASDLMAIAVDVEQMIASLVADLLRLAEAGR